MLTGKVSMFYPTQYTHFNITDVKIAGAVFYIPSLYKASHIQGQDYRHRKESDVKMEAGVEGMMGLRAKDPQGWLLEPDTTKKHGRALPQSLQGEHDPATILISDS